MRTSLSRKLLPLTGFLAVSSLVISSESGLRPPGMHRPSGFTGRNPAPAFVPSGAEKTSRAALKSAYGRLPLHFEPNLGQFDPQVRHMARGAGYTLFLTDAEAVMVLSRSQRRPSDPLRRQEEPQQAWSFTNGVLQDASPADLVGELYIAGRDADNDLWWYRSTGNQWTWVDNRGVAAGPLATGPR